MDASHCAFELRGGLGVLAAGEMFVAKVAAVVDGIGDAQALVSLAFAPLWVDLVAHLAQATSCCRVVAQARQYLGNEVDQHRQVGEHQDDEDPIQRPPGAHDVYAAGDLQQQRKQNDRTHPCVLGLEAAQAAS